MHVGRPAGIKGVCSQSSDTFLGDGGSVVRVGNCGVAVPVFLCVTFSAGVANTAGLPDSATVRPPLRPAATETQR